MHNAAYYEVVLPKVFRVGVRPDADLQICGGEIRVDRADRRLFNYVIVGDADTYEGLAAPFHEEETVAVAVVEDIGAGDEIVACWKRKANTNQFDGRLVEYARLDAIPAPTPAKGRRSLEAEAEATQGASPARPRPNSPLPAPLSRRC
jgi:hypothetical protein